ncbi:MAG: 1-acyl-sn-glycerol-3-phosphate acyltransferase [Deltaproteobacteria bacterium]|nr:1-acyl-sn-glycerol-3-phosphate acyltransferase [Deltaproteobacteria bacterium]
MLILRSLLFNILFWIVTFTLSTLVVIFRPLGIRAVYPIGRFWSRTGLFLLRIICGVTYEVKTNGKLPEGPAVFLSNHQSAWETMAYPALFPPFMWVLKRELMYVPIFGWCLMALGHIGINRKAGSRAIKQINAEGKKILTSGFNMIIFPEGTRISPGEVGNFNPGGVGLAIGSGVPVVPVTHNAGRLWGKSAFAKKPGHITVVIDEPISTEGLPPSDRKALNEKVRNIIVKRMEEISP